jgi:hypothetical protein
MQAGRLVGQLAPGLPLLRDRLGADHIVRPVARRCTCALLRPERCRVVALAFGWRRCGIYLEVRRSCTSSAHLRHSTPLEIPHAAGRRGGRAGRRGMGVRRRRTARMAVSKSSPGLTCVAWSRTRPAPAQWRRCAIVPPLSTCTVHRARARARRRGTTPPASECTAVGSRPTKTALARQGEWATVDEAAAVDLEVGTGPCSLPVAAAFRNGPTL